LSEKVCPIGFGFATIESRDTTIIPEASRSASAGRHSDTRCGCDKWDETQNIHQERLGIRRSDKGSLSIPSRRRAF
jgi:hypothetical protein